MKKMFLVILVISFAAVNVYSQTGIIREMTGEVELRPVGSAEFIPAQTGSRVARDTIVSTGFRATAVIEVGSTVITVRPLTRLSLAEIQSSAGEETLNVNLQAGRVRVEVSPPSGTRANTSVQSPSATASVRGTTFDMDTAAVSVIEGRVHMQGSNGLIVPVTAGFSSEITGDGSAQDPHEKAAAEIMPLPPEGAGLSGEETQGNSPVTGTIDIDLNWQ